MMRRILAFGALLGWCAALLVLRVVRSGSYTFVFLTWNLFLAAVPFAAAALLETLNRRRGWLPLQWGAFLLWLLFLPNAPYIITDLMHLKARPPVPLWYDVLLLISCAGTGLLFGYASVLMVQRVVERRFRRVTGWVVAVSTLVLSAYGIYLGRFLRFNSWEAITDPLPLFSDMLAHLTDPMQHPRTLAVTVLFGIALTLGYVALRVMVDDDDPAAAAQASARRS
jgi:uncharacterized membrane protein